MRYQRSLFAVFAVCTAFGAAADTVYLNNGTRFDGEIRQQPNGLYAITLRGNTLYYRPEEIEKIEKNDKTGAFNRAEAEARWAERDAELTKQTGLNAAQRDQVKQLVYQLKTDDAAVRRRVRNQLVSLQERMNVYKFLAFSIGEMSHRLSPWVLEAMFYVDQKRVTADLETYAHHAYYGTRAKALALMGELQDPRYTDILTRGLVDAQLDVKVQAAYSLAEIGARQCTPALIASMRSNDLRLQNACQLALESLWKEAIGEGDKPSSPQDWLALWNSQAGQYNKPITLANLEPLIDPQFEYQDE